MKLSDGDVDGLVLKRVGWDRYENPRKHIKMQSSSIFRETQLINKEYDYKNKNWGINWEKGVAKGTRE